jgi:glycosyltransferase involved in cell wall biosynthesis
MAGALPSKMFEVMAASLPVVLSAPAGEALRLITRAKAGVHARPEDPEALADAIAGLVARRDEARAMGQNARAYVFAHYDRARIAESFVAKLVNR